MKRRLLFVVLVLIGVLVSLQWPGHAREVNALAASACSGPACAPRMERDAGAKAPYQRPAEIPYPDDNQYSAAKSALGRLLFFDPILSRSGATSCASCHNPGLSWADNLPRSIGDTGEELPIRAPTLLNVAWVSMLGWDGKFSGLESMTFAPITGRMNMNLAEPVLLTRLTAIPGYVDQFEAAFGDRSVTRERIEKAVATFERSIVSPPAPFDRWIDGDAAAIDETAKRGFDLFNGRAGCAACHSGWAFTDNSFHDIGTATGDDLGRGTRFTSSVKLRYAFKVPTLRDAARRGPFMHDGSVPTLAAVIDLYDKGGIDRPSRSPKIKPLNLTDAEKADLIAFLNTLTSDPEPTVMPVLPR